MTLTSIDKPEQVAALAAEGRVPKDVLASLLPIEKRETFLAACAAIERAYTDACRSTGDPCLESGCSMDGEVCLQPVLNAGTDYNKACAAEWIKLAKG